MIPKKAKDFIAEQAKILGIPEEDLDAMVTEYFRELQDAMRQLKHPRLLFLGMGSLKLSTKRAKKAIEEMRAFQLRNEGRLTQAILDEKENELEKLSKILEIREEDYEREKVVRARIKEYKRTKQNDTEREISEGLGEQKSDS